MKCVKCGTSGTQFGFVTKYHVGAYDPGPKCNDECVNRYQEGEHLHIFCGLCGYDWTELCCDAGEVG